MPAKMTGDTLHKYMDEYYRPKDTIVAIAGSFTKDDIQFICDLFSEMEGSGRNVIEPAGYAPKIVVRPKEIEQNHLCIAFPGLPIRAEERYVNALMGAILGGAWHPACSAPCVRKTVCAIRCTRSTPRMRTPACLPFIPLLAKRQRARRSS